MAGHSKWANIQFRKKTQDAKRGKLFTKLIREITVSAKQGGSDLNHNTKLRQAIDKALTANLSKDTVERAIQRGIASTDDAHLETIRYEGYAPAGVAVMVDCLTDNKNRSIAEVRNAFSKCGGQVASSGSVAYLFTERGEIFIENTTENSVLEIAIECGATDVISLDTGVLILTSPEGYLSIKNQLISKGFSIASSELTWASATDVSVDRETETTILRLIELLEALDDVQTVYTNLAMTAS